MSEVAINMKDVNILALGAQQVVIEMATQQ